MRPSVRWWLLRHGPVPCPKGYIYGTEDLDCEPGSPAPALRASLPKRALLVESGLRRCRQTSLALGLTAAPVIEPDLIEQNFGLWQGKNWNTLEDPGLVAFWDNPARIAPPGGESFAEVCLRVRRGIERLSRQTAEGDIIAVVHAGTIRAALALALDLSPEAALRILVAPLSLSLLRLGEGGWQVEGLIPFGTLCAKEGCDRLVCDA